MPESVRALVLAGDPLYADGVRAAKLAGIPKIKELKPDGSHIVEARRSAPSRSDIEHRTGSITSVFEHPATAYSAYHAVFSYDTALVLPSPWCPVLLLNSSVDSLAAADDRFCELAPRTERHRIETDVIPIYWTKAQELARRATESLDTNWLSVP